MSDSFKSLDYLEEFWQIVPHQSNTTNCIMPKYLLKRAIDAQWTLPLIFKVTNLSTNRYAICVADNFFDTDENDHMAMLSPIIIEYLGLTDIASIEIINQSPDLIPPKAKTIYLEPQSHHFYTIDDPKTVLEECLKNSHICGQDYIIPIDANVSIKIIKLLDEKSKQLQFADINNTDLNVEFLPIPESTETPPNNVIRKPNKTKKIAIRKDTNRIETQESSAVQTGQPMVAVQTGQPMVAVQTGQPMAAVQTGPPAPLYNRERPWVPFCGWGRSLINDSYIAGRPQE
jgi:hypothetical protein